MPQYTFHCEKCDNDFETYLPMQEGRWTLEQLKAMPKDKAQCPDCGVESTDKIISANIEFIGTKVESAEFNPGLGCVVKNKRHKEDILKARGLVEVGNDFGTGEKQQSHFEKQKQEEKERTWKKIVDEADV